MLWLPGLGGGIVPLVPGVVGCAVLWCPGVVVFPVLWFLVVGSAVEL